MNNRTLLLVLLALGFVGATSCGPDPQVAGLQAENAALQQQLALKNAQVGATGVTVTQIATAVANVTVTQATTAVSTSYGTTVIYTMTSNSVGTAIH